MPSASNDRTASGRRDRRDTPRRRSLTTRKAWADVARIADNPKAAANVCTTQPEVMPNTESTPARASLRQASADDIEGVLAGRQVQKEATEDEEREILGAEHVQLRGHPRSLRAEMGPDRLRPPALRCRREIGARRADSSRPAQSFQTASVERPFSQCLSRIVIPPRKAESTKRLFLFVFRVVVFSWPDTVGAELKLSKYRFFARGR